MKNFNRLFAVIISIVLIFPNNIFAMNLRSNDIEHINQRKSQMPYMDNLVKESSKISLTQEENYDSQGRRKYVEGELIIKYKETSKYSTQSNILNHYNLEVKESSPKEGIKLVTIPESKDLVQFADILSRDSSIEYVEPNYIYYPNNISSDPLSSQLWGLENIGQAVDYSKGVKGIDIDVLEAWKYTMGREDVIVAVIDTGTDINHPDLKDNIWKNPEEISDGRDNDGNGYIDDLNGWDFYNDDNSVFDIEDVDDHGTHVSGTISAQKNNIGIVGVAPNVKIMPLKFIGPHGGSTMDAILAIEYAKSKGAKIINASWGGGGYSRALEETIKNSGALFVAAAGNNGLNNDYVPDYPSNYNCYNIISIAAVDNQGINAEFSNYGRATVDIAAPGVSILSTVPKGDSNNYHNAYEYYSGTSMAAPHVSSIAALLYSNGTTNPLHIKMKIMESGKRLNSLKGTTLSGRLASAGAALNMPELDDDDFIPGIQLKANNTGNLSYKNDLNDIYHIDLIAGERISIELNGEKDTDFDLHLYSPDTKYVDTSNGIIKSSENIGTNEIIEYEVLNNGRYFINVYAYSGEGKYSLTYIKEKSTKTEIFLDDRDINIIYTGGWKKLSNSLYENDTLSFLNESGRAETSFLGSRISISGYKGPDQGIAEVVVNGVIDSEIDFYSPIPKYKQVVFEKDLDYQENKVEIVWTGMSNKNAKKTMTTINIDTVEISSKNTGPKAPKLIDIEQLHKAVKLRWRGNENKDVEYFNVYKSEDNKEFEMIYREEADQFKDNDEYYFYEWDLENKKYYYKIEAIGKDGIKSKFSNIVSGQPLFFELEFTIDNKDDNVEYIGNWIEEQDKYSPDNTIHSTNEVGAKLIVPFDGYVSSIYFHVTEGTTVNIQSPDGWTNMDEFSTEWIGCYNSFSRDRVSDKPWVFELISGEIGFDKLVVLDNIIDIPNDIIEDDSYEIWPEKVITDNSYEWEIRFNQKLNPDTINKSNIYIIDEYGNKLDYINPIIKDGNTIRLQNNKAFQINKHYYIIIKSDVKSISENSIENGIKMKFVVR